MTEEKTEISNRLYDLLNASDEKFSDDVKDEQNDSSKKSQSKPFVRNPMRDPVGAGYQAQP